MKKIVMACWLVAVVMSMPLPTLALIGMEDDVPGYDVLVPFFFVSMPGHGHDNTLIVITEVCQSHVHFLYGIYDRASRIQGNGTMAATPCGVISTDALTLISQMSPAGREALAVDLDGDSTKDHYCGYMIWQNAEVVMPKNQAIATIYQVNLWSGMAAAAISRHGRWMRAG